VTAPGTVVLVHGLYLNGREMALLGARLTRAGYAVRRFHYPSLRAAPADNAARLAAFVADLRAPLHFVAHSLGGIVVRHLFAGDPQPEGRTVTLGTPHSGCAAAVRLARRRAGRALLGRALERGLLGDLPPWPAERELGSVAGSLNLGLGRLVPGVPRPNDGSVAVVETRLPGMCDHLVLPVSHFGLLCSRRAAAATLEFLAHGCFRHAAGARATADARF